MILKIIILFVMFILLLSAIALWLAYGKLKNLEKFTDALLQDRGNMVKRIKELEIGALSKALSEALKANVDEGNGEESPCPDCLGTGIIEEDAGGGNIKRFLCERCEATGERRT